MCGGSRAGQSTPRRSRPMKTARRSGYLPLLSLRSALIPSFCGRKDSAENAHASEKNRAWAVFQAVPQGEWLLRKKVKEVQSMDEIYRKVIPIRPVSGYETNTARWMSSMRRIIAGVFMSRY